MNTPPSQKTSRRVMWPFAGLSLERASFWFGVANAALLASLVVGVVSTFTIVRLGNVKEWWWDRLRASSNERVATAGAEAAQAKENAAKANTRTEELRAANLALQKRMLPRRLGALISFSSGDETPPTPAGVLQFGQIKKFAGTKVWIQCVPDFEAQTLANDVLAITKAFGWDARLVTEKDTKFPSLMFDPGVYVMFGHGMKLRDAAQSLADGFAKAKLAGPTAGVDRYGKQFSVAQGLPIDSKTDLETKYSDGSFPKLPPNEEAVTVLIGMKPMHKQLGEAQ